MKTKFLCVIALTAILFGGCNKAVKAPLPADYLGGEFVYYADAASFYDCATGKRYPVSNGGAYLSVERGYLSMNPDGLEQIYITMRGHVEQLPAMEGNELVATVVIDTLLEFDRTVSCDPNFRLSGMYESETERVKSLLRLHANYTYSETTFASDTTEVLIEGTWGRVSDLMLALNATSPTASQELFEIIPDQQSLVCNNNTKPRIYRRVYVE